MDIRDPKFKQVHDNLSKVHDSAVLFRLGPDGKMHKRPPCADCGPMGMQCDKCKDNKECLEIDCYDCKFEDICEESGLMSDAEDVWPDKMGNDFLEKVDKDVLRHIEEAAKVFDEADVPKEDRVVYPWDFPYPGLHFNLTSYYISQIENGLIIYYKRTGDTESRKRFFPDTESLCRFIKHHTKRS